MKINRWICGALLVMVSVVPILAATNDGKSSDSNSSTTTTNPSTASAVNSGANVTALLGVLVMKGVLAPAEANAIRDAAPEAQFKALVDALARKGVVSAADLPPTAPAGAKESAAAPAPAGQGTPLPLKPVTETKGGGTVIAAVAPLRVLPIDPPVRDGLVPGIRLGGVKITPYGFIKATAVHDSSQPNGDDFPFPGIFLNSSDVFSTGPTRDPSFHLKARSSRFGANFEWLDIAPRLALTGRVEGDMEGNFSEVDNADVTSIRNPGPRLRVAYVRADFAASDRTDVFFEGGRTGRCLDRRHCRTSWKRRSWAPTPAMFGNEVRRCASVLCANSETAIAISSSLRSSRS